MVDGVISGLAQGEYTFLDFGDFLSGLERWSLRLGVGGALREGVELVEADLRLGVEGVSRVLEGVCGRLRPFNIAPKMFKLSWS